MQIGDYVTVIRARAFGHDKCIPVRVVEVRPESFGVEALKESFDDEGRVLLYLQKCDKGRTWE